MIKYYLQRVVLATNRFALFDHIYRALYRSVAWAVVTLIKRWPAVKTVQLIRGDRHRDFLPGLSDIDLIAVLSKRNLGAYQAAVRGLGLLNRWLPKVIPIFQFCFTLDEAETTMPAISHWVGVHDLKTLRAIGGTPPENYEGAVRLVALRNAFRWFFTYYQPNVLGPRPRGQTLRNEKRRFFRIVRDLYFGMGLYDHRLYQSEACFLQKQLEWSVTLNLSEASPKDLIAEQEFFRGEVCFRALWSEFARLTQRLTARGEAPAEGELDCFLGGSEVASYRVKVVNALPTVLSAGADVFASPAMLGVYGFVFPPAAVGNPFTWVPPEPPLQDWSWAYDRLQIGRNFRESLVDSPTHLEKLAALSRGSAWERGDEFSTKDRWRTYLKHSRSVGEKHDELISYIRTNEKTWRDLPATPFYFADDPAL